MVVDHFSPDQVRALRKIAGKSGATLFGLLLGAYQILLHRLSRQERFVVGFPAAGQNGSAPGGLVGHCVNFLPFVAGINETEAFSEFLKSTQRRLLDALEHQEFTYGRLIKKFSADERPLIEAVFNLERVNDGLAMPGLKTEVAEIDRGYTSNPLFLKAREYEAGLEIRFDYQTSLFDGESVGQWLAIYRAILEGVIERPGATVQEVACSLPDSRMSLLREWNQTSTDYPRDKTVSELFDEVASRRGAATALRFDRGTMSYAELASLTDRIAHGLASLGVKPGDRIAIFLERSPEAIASLYAVLKNGAVCVPLDPEYPADRLHFLLSDSGATLAIAEAGWMDRLPGDLTSVTPDRLAKDGQGRGSFPAATQNAGDAASILYTSGSTGKPKGALIPHRAMVRLVRNTNYCHFSENEVFLFASSPCFDASIFEIQGALLNGGILALPPAGRLTLEVIAETLATHEVTTLWLTAGLFQIMAEECPEAFVGLRQLISGGDVMSPFHAAKILAMHSGIRLLNGYGPTESTTFTCVREVEEADLFAAAIPVGNPISNSTAWILDQAGNPVQPGVPGELCTGGDGLALGYLNRPELTAEKFISDPYSSIEGGLLYRTGDLCRQRADGSIMFMGRIDQQVKIRGFRVEPGEIEACLGRHPLVGQCKVVVRGVSAAEKSLAAYVSPVNGVKPAPAELIGYMRAKLPEYLVPASLVVLDTMPLNANGKIDTRALPESKLEPASAVEEMKQPTETETALTGIWKELLHTFEIGLDDDFFCLGGHSLLGMRMFSRIQKRFDVSLPLAVLFRAPSVRQLATLIDERRGAATVLESSTDDVEKPEDAPVPSRRGGIHLTGTQEARSNVLAETTVAIQPKGDLPPLFAVHGGDGGILFYGNLASRLGEERPFYAFEAPALTATSPIPDETVEETASHYLAELRKVQPEGPYHLCGYSFGGVVAYDMARQLLADGEQVEFLGLVDTENPAVEARKLSISERIAVNWNKRNLADKGVIEKVGKIGARIGSGLAYRLYFEAEDAVARTLPQAKGAGWLRQVQLRKAHEKAMEFYEPGTFNGKLTLFRALVGGDKFAIGDDYGWSDLVDDLEIVDVPGNHVSVFHRDNIDAIAAAFRKALQAIETPLKAD